MCVISVVIDKRPTPAMVVDMWNANPHGGGVAWREGEGENKVVRWEKNLELGDMQEYIATLPMPFVAHFRVASCGGVKPELTHPFAVDEFEKSLDLEGATKGTVLFHNGHWNQWKSELLSTTKSYRRKLPAGKWTDTRAMAWLINLIGPGYPEILDEGRTVIFGPNIMEITGSWTKVDDIWCSNEIFVNKAKSHHSGSNAAWATGWNICRHSRCTEKKDLDAEGYCKEHTANKPGPKLVTTGTQGGSHPLSPFELRQKLADMEAKWGEMKAGKIKRGDLPFSKNELKRYRAAVGELPPLQLPSSVAH